MLERCAEEAWADAIASRDIMGFVINRFRANK